MLLASLLNNLLRLLLFHLVTLLLHMLLNNLLRLLLFHLVTLLLHHMAVLMHSPQFPIILHNSP